MERSFVPVLYRKEFQPLLIAFMEQCLPESGRTLDINGRHSVYKDVEKGYKKFRCMFDGEKMIGAVAVNELDEKSCELKSLFLLKRYHGMGHGKCLIEKAIGYANECGYEKMYLDTLSESKRAIGLYHRYGFADTKRYNNNQRADVFMVLDLKH